MSISTGFVAPTNGTVKRADGGVCGYVCVDETMNESKCKWTFLSFYCHLLDSEQRQKDLKVPVEFFAKMDHRINEGEQEKLGEN